MTPANMTPAKKTSSTATIQPYVPASRNLPELTLKAILLGAILSVALAAANAYLGLFAGLTVSASIPAAVISMGVLRFFKNSNILENNLVQTAASAGEALAAGAIFTLPALILMGVWSEFGYWQTTFIVGAGGILGVLFTVPLRSALIVKQGLQFPEGVATYEVLKTGAEGGQGMKSLAAAGILGGALKYLGGGANLWAPVLDLAAAPGRWFLYFGMNLSPALMAVGYIVGLNIALVVFTGGAISWWIAIPAYFAYNGFPEDVGIVDAAYSVWNSQIRYLGVGSMVVGGLWTLIELRSTFVTAIRESLDAIAEQKRRKKGTSQNKTPRTEKDTPMNWVVAGIVFMLVPIFVIYFKEIEILSVSLLMTVLMVAGGFLFAAVAGYMAGLVGSSNNPISGVTIATILTSSLLLLLLLGSDSSRGPAAAILIGAVVCCAAAIAGDNMQDLKAGQLVGATPWKQQVMQLIGVVAGALAIGPVLNLLQVAYGFGAKTAEHPQALAAPQANLMKSVADGVFGNSLPWDMIFAGAILGALVIILDKTLQARKASFRTPVLAISIGIYLPFELNAAILVGGLVWGLLEWAKKKAKSSKQKSEESSRTGLLFASGLIAGEALVGILLAVPIALVGRGDVLHWVSKSYGPWPGVVLVLGTMALLYRLASRGLTKKH